jgi:UDP-N-acetylmuramate dehydrogenase
MVATFKVIKNKKLSNLSTFAIGGMVEYFCEAKTEHEILDAIFFAKNKNIPWRVMGGGSNILFSQKKIKGLLIKLGDKLVQKNGNEIAVFAGTFLDKIVVYSLKNGFSGLESLTAIPGSVGGAIYGNAGAYGHSIGDYVSRVEIITNGKKKIISKKSCEFGYRDSVFKRKDYVIVRVFLKLEKRNIKKAREISKKIREERIKKYPHTLKCPGSFFKNPLVSEISKLALKKIDSSKIIGGKIPAGYLLESVGARGMHVGGIKIANYHGNLFINTGNATEENVKNISQILKNRVKQKFGIKLCEEVQFIK